jgi:hypothetical protein
MKENENELNDLSRSILRLSKVLGDASEIIMSEGVSNYPIFVFYREFVEIGIFLVKPNAQDQTYGVNASSLEEISARQVIATEKVEDFKKIFKDPLKFFCIFLVGAKGGSFIFHPR